MVLLLLLALRQVLEWLGWQQATRLKGAKGGWYNRAGDGAASNGCTDKHIIGINMFYFKLFVCTFYGLVSIAQTLTTRYLFRTLAFRFYSTVFFLQRIVIVLTSSAPAGQNIFRLRTLAKVAPYSFLMCTINMLTSYCVTVMPLAAFMAFKKFVVFFVLVVGICMSIPNSFNRVHHCCIFAIVVGGLMIGETDIFRGEFLGYLASLVYTFLEALTLQMSTLLYQRHGISPRDLMVANSVISMPYYFSVLLWEKEYEGIFNYFTRPLSPFFYEALLYTFILALASEYTGNIISMKISPFEKASVSNIKDLVLTLISIKYFKDVTLNPVSEFGIVFCLSASLIFSISLMEGSQGQAPQLLETQQLGWEASDELTEAKGLVR